MVVTVAVLPGDHAVSGRASTTMASDALCRDDVFLLE
jgi:hypothetical protein